MLMCCPCKPPDVTYLHQRICGTFSADHACSRVLAEDTSYGIEVPGFDKFDFDPSVLSRVVQKPVHAPVDIGGGEHHVAWLEQADHGTEGCHAGGEGERLWRQQRSVTDLKGVSVTMHCKHLLGVLDSCAQFLVKITVST